MRRPPAPTYARRCPHRYRDAPEPLHHLCPVVLARKELAQKEQRDLVRLFGIEKGGDDG